MLRGPSGIKPAELGSEFRLVSCTNPNIDQLNVSILEYPNNVKLFQDSHIAIPGLFTQEIAAKAGPNIPQSNVSQQKPIQSVSDSWK